MLVEPGIKRRLRLLDQHHLRQPGPSRRFHGEFAGDFVERSGQREHNILLRQRLLRMEHGPTHRAYAAGSGAYFHGREAIHVARGLPGENIGRAIDARYG